MNGARNIGSDLLRVVAAYCVVLIHTPAHGEAFGLKWSVVGLLPPANASFALMAGFFMLRGFERKWGDTGTVVRLWFGERMRRIVCPFLVWTVVYVALNMLFDVVRHQPLTFDLGKVSVWCSIFLQGAGSAQLWFVPALFYSQLLLAVLYVLFRRMMDRRSGFLVFLLMVGVVAALESVVLPQNSYLWRLAFVNGYVFLGAFLGELRLNPIWNRWLAVLSVIGLLGSIGGRLVLDNVAVGWRYGYPLCWFYWACLRDFGWRSDSAFGRVVSDVAQTSFGIYFVHMIPVTLFPFMFRLGGSSFDFSRFPVVMAFVYFLLSFVAVKALSRIQGARFVFV